MSNRPEEMRSFPSLKHPSQYTINLDSISNSKNTIARTKQDTEHDHNPPPTQPNRPLPGNSSPRAKRIVEPQATNATKASSTHMVSVPYSVLQGLIEDTKRLKVEKETSVAEAVKLKEQLKVVLSRKETIQHSPPNSMARLAILEASRKIIRNSKDSHQSQRKISKTRVRSASWRESGTDSKSQELENLVSATRSIAHQSAYRGLVSAIVQSALAKGAEKFALILADKERQVLRTYATWTRLQVPGGYREEPEIDLSFRTIPGQVILTGNSVHVDVKIDGTNPALPAVEQGLSSIQYLYCTPLFSSGEHAVGALMVINPLEDQDTVVPFSMEYIEEIQHLGYIAGASISNLLLSEDRERAQARILSLMKMSRSVSAETNAEAVLERITQVSYELLEADRIAIFVKIPGENLLQITNAQDGALGHCIPFSSGIAGYVATTGEMLSVDDAQNHPSFDPTLDAETGYVTKSILCTPVKDPDGNLLAVVEAINRQNGDRFNSEDALFLNYVAEAAGIALHKWRMHQEMEIAKQLTELRFEMTISSADDCQITSFMDKAMKRCQDILRVDTFRVLLVDWNKNELWLVSQENKNEVNRIPTGAGILGYVAMTRETLCLLNAMDHANYDAAFDAPYGHKSILCMPIFQDNDQQVVAAVALAVRTKRDKIPFGHSDKQTMSKICTEIQFALAQLSLELSYFKVYSDGLMKGEVQVLPSPTRRASKVHRHVPQSADITTSLLAYFHRDNSNLDRRLTHVHATLSDLPRRSQSEIDQWDLNAFSMQPLEISSTAIQLLQSYGLQELFALDLQALTNFMHQVVEHYRDNPFHNIYHGFQTMHAVHIMLHRQCLDYVTPVETLALLIASLCHDLDHPGNNNDYEVKSQSARAIMHNDDAVLERHHCRMTFMLLQETDCHFLSELSSSDYKHFRKMVIAGILATDMTKHFEMCKQTEHHSKEELMRHRPLLVELLVHSADLIGQALPLVQAREWGDRVLEEFSAQVAMEKEAQLPFAPYMDNLDDAEAALKVQIGFINFVLLPLWTPMVAKLPSLQFYVDSLHANFNTFKSELETYENPDLSTSTAADENPDLSKSTAADPDLHVRPASPTSPVE